VYDDADETARAETVPVEPLFVCRVARPSLRRCRDRCEDRLARFRKLGMPLDDVAPTFEREDDASPVRIERLPHASIFGASARRGNWAKATCP
jgi:hypothetical protein